MKNLLNITLETLMQILIHVFFVGIAVHTRLQEVLLGVALGAKRVGHRGRPTLCAAPHRCVHLALGGLNLQYGGVGQGCGNMGQRGDPRTLDREEAARLHYKETGRSLDNVGCIGDPHIVVDRCVVFLCILHCCMAIGRLQVAFIETRLVDLPKENVNAVQRVLYRARTGGKLGASAAPEWEVSRASFLAWEELHPLLDYVPEDGEWQAVVAMRDLLWELYTDKPPRGDLRAAEVARAYRAHCCKEACQSN